MSDTLTALDATFLELEQQDEGALMGIGGVSVFDPIPGGGAPSIEEMCANLSARLDYLARYSQRLSSTRTGGLRKAAASSAAGNPGAPPGSYTAPRWTALRRRGPGRTR